MIISYNMALTGDENPVPDETSQVSINFVFGTSLGYKLGTSSNG